MDTGELRRQILRALDEARRTSVVRRRAKDEAAAAYERFLAEIAAPLFRQAVLVLRAEGHAFDVQTPADRVRLVRDGAPDTFIELELDASAPVPQVVGRVSLTRGRTGVVVEERPVADATPVAELTEGHVSAFLVDEIPKIIVGN
jgi:hypothetical protein